MSKQHETLRAVGRRAVGVAFLLALLVAQMALSSARQSAAFDETYHLVSGYAYLHTGSPRLSWEHPPVPQVLAALPLLRKALAPFPTGHPGWQAGNAEAFVDDYLWVDNAAIAPALIQAGRVPLMVLTAAFGLALFVALFTLVGEPAAWIGLTLFAFDPNIIANGRIIGNDLAVAGFMFVAVWRLGAYFRRPTPLNLLLTGVAVGLAIASKLTAAFLVPVFLLLTFTSRMTNHASRMTNYGSHILALVGMALVATFTVWAVFGFEVGPLYEGGFPVPAPTYLRGLPRMFQRVARGTPTFLLGRTSDTGWWYYFILTFLLKTPLPTLLLMGIGLVRAVRNWRETALWWLPAGLYLLIASGSTLQIGYRYILPTLIFGIALAASGFPTWPRVRRQQIAMALLGLWLVADAVYVFPDHLAYSNALAGGPDNTWRHFADMNVDWGMDLVALREYIAAHPTENVYLAYFGSAYPSAYGVTARLLPGFSRLLSGPEYAGFNPYTPEPGTYAISVTSLHLGLLYEGRELYAFFRNREPDARAGRSILIYRVSYPPEMPVVRAVVTGTPIWQQPPETLGVSAGRRLIASWAGAGAVVLPVNGPTRFIVQAAIPETEPVRVAIASGDVRAALANIPVGTATTPGSQSVTLPVRFEGGPSLAGWELNTTEVAPGETLRLITYWQVKGPLTPPLSVFVHIIDTQGRPIAQWDGWPVATSGLEQGDIVVLEHPITLPAATPPGDYPLQIGLYRPPNGARLSVLGEDRLILTQIRLH
ncbi:MAG TPA: phospholipid carrier-dependent glycosyltransferase [Anaerolineae bacterium]|nr:phospholipid carrier-dependent glycosyltransferase [Anaerolineae bacterium]HQK12601.1 phospholipid carrier-dependent glycosyltransferase [Anaerolineae bacterium]